MQVSVSEEGLLAQAGSRVALPQRLSGSLLPIALRNAQAMCGDPNTDRVVSAGHRPYTGWSSMVFTPRVPM